MSGGMARYVLLCRERRTEAFVDVIIWFNMLQHDVAYRHWICPVSVLFEWWRVGAGPAGRGPAFLSALGWRHGGYQGWRWRHPNMGQEKSQLAPVSEFWGRKWVVGPVMATVSQRVAFFFRSVMMSRPEIRNLALNLLQNSLVFFLLLFILFRLKTMKEIKWGGGGGRGKYISRPVAREYDPASVEMWECGEHTILKEIYHIEMMKGQRSLRFHFENFVETLEVGVFRHPVLGFGTEFVDESATQDRLENGAFIIVPEMFHFHVIIPVFQPVFM